jgi:hypothetical protein
MDGLEVGDSLFLDDGAEFGSEVDLVFANISRNLALCRAVLSSLDLTGAQIGGELQLGSAKHPAPVWQKESQLILRNAGVGAVQDSGEKNAWPDTLNLNGFTYSRLGGLYGDGGRSDIAARKAKDFIAWLGKSRNYSPQPYQQLASVLRSMGRPETASAILYAGKERERCTANMWKWWGLSFLNWTIGYGYGYRYFWSLLWVVGLTLVGVAVLDSVKLDESLTLPEMLAFSFDLLLPIITLDDSHKITFEGWQRYYFYLHQLLGFILGSFVVAGLSGITKK